MGRKWVWFILVVALLLFISLEAATADSNGNGKGNGNGGGEGNGAGGHGNNNGSEGDGQGNKGGNGNGNGQGDGQGNQDGNGKGQGDGNGKGKGDGQGNQDGNGKGGGDGHGDEKSPPPPPSQTPPYYPPPSLTPPSSPPPSTTPPSSPPASPTPPSVTPPSQTPPSSSTPPSQTPPSYSTPPSQTPPSSSTPPSQTPPSVTPPSQTPPPFSTPPSQTPPSVTPPSQSPPAQSPPSISPPNSPPPTDDSTDYYVLSPVERTGQERAICEAHGACYNKTLTCPAECPYRKPSDYNMKGCYIDCSSKCEATCKWRKPNCDNYGSLCYDPRFVGGDGNMFYFHGSKGSDFAIVTDENIQINAHFIGTRPMGRTRDFTWVQALSIMFDTHTLVLAARRVPKWDDKVEALIVKWNGKIINIPTDGEAEWRINTENRVVAVERTDDFNTVRATVSGLVQVDTRVVPIGEQENKVHHYQIPADDAFSHLETQFKFFKLTDSVEGVLGRTYQPGFESPVKVGVPMPMMGGEDKYRTPSLNSPLCNACKFQRPTNSIAMVTAI